MFFLIILVFLIGSAGCIYQEGRESYKRGEIEVIFRENVTLENATKLLENYNLSIDDYFYATYDSQKNTLRAIVKVPEGNEKYYVDLLKQEEQIYDVRLQYIDY